ncbi:MAG: aldo/keto reductase [Victivallales bacterium]|nr:aldo/keto reductase [Victivallales bacterium]
MEYRKCGKFDLKLSVLGFGCWQLGGGNYWGKVSNTEAANAVAAAVDNGINYFDSAEVYNDGRSEISLGLALKNIPRNKVIVGSKVSPSNAYAGELEKHCEASLCRMGLDYIDIYMLHWPLNPYSLEHFTDDQSKITDPPTMLEAVQSLEKLKKNGKIRYYGVSNFGCVPMTKAIDYGAEITVNQLPYSLLTRAIEIEAIPYCARHGIGIIGYMTLLQGVLSGRYRNLLEIPDMQRRTCHFDSKNNPKARHRGRGYEKETLQTLNELSEIASECESSIAELAIRWAVANRAVTCALIGSTNPGRIESNTVAVSTTLAPELLDRLNRATELLKKIMGPGFDYYAPITQDRTSF